MPSSPTGRDAATRAARASAERRSLVGYSWAEGTARVRLGAALHSAAVSGSVVQSSCGLLHIESRMAYFHNTFSFVGSSSLGKSIYYVKHISLVYSKLRLVSNHLPTAQPGLLNRIAQADQLQPLDCLAGIA